MFDFLGAGLISIVAFAAVISFVVVIHELGHYWAGRLFGVHAEAFSVGFGPTLTAWRDKRGTIWRIAAFPIGGYVRFRGDENAASAPDAESLERMRAEAGEEGGTVFHFKPVWQRALIVLAGPFANFVLAVAIFAVFAMARGELVIEPRIGSVVEQSAADQAGFEPGDVITAINGEPVASFTEVTQAVYMQAGREMRVEVRRNGETLTLTPTPRREMRADGLGGERAMGFLGVGLAEDAEISRVRYAPWEAPIYGVERTGELVGTILSYMGRLVTGQASFEHVNGPLGIATTAGQIANNAVSGGEPAPAAPSPGVLDRAEALIAGLLLLAGLLSVAIGLMNLLPIPVLDGGHLVYYAYEAVAGRPPSPALQATGFRIGLALVLGLMLVATWNDVGYLRELFS